MSPIIRWPIVLLLGLVLAVGSTCPAADREGRIRVLVLVDESAYPSLQAKLDRYYADVQRSFDAEFRTLVEPFYEMPPEKIRDLLKREYDAPDARIRGAIMVGPIPCALRGSAGGPLTPAPLYYEDFDARWADDDGDGAFDRVDNDADHNPTEIWTAWWVPPANDPQEQVLLLNRWLDKLHRFHTGEIKASDGLLFLAAGGVASVEITESWHVLLSGVLAPVGGTVTAYSRYAEMPGSVRPPSNRDFTPEELSGALTAHAWLHVHTVSHGAPDGLYLEGGAITSAGLDFSRFDQTGPLIMTTSGCSNGNFRGTNGAEANYAASIGNRLLFSDRTLTVAYFGSASPQSSGVFAMYYNDLIESLDPSRGSYIAAGYYRMRNRDSAWGVVHYIFRGLDEKILSGDPFARYPL
jgi:hypothetical protein